MDWIWIGYSCIEHTLHLMATHFISALKIPSLRTTKGELRKAQNDMDDVDDEEDENDVDTSMDVEAVGREATAQDINLTSFRPGDVVGKIMAFISQLRLSGENIRDYLKTICISRGCPPLDIKIWVRTRWGSLSDCFRVILSQQKVCQTYYNSSQCITQIVNNMELELQAIDDFCVLADNDRDLPPLSHGREWADYRLSPSEWKIIELAQDCLRVSVILSLNDFLLNSTIRLLRTPMASSQHTRPRRSTWSFH